jgi:hypothetical protein
MKAADETLLIPHQRGFQSWHVKGGQIQPGSDEPKSWRNVKWVAMPTKNMLCLPMRLGGVDAARREAAVQLELEAAGFGQEVAQPNDFDLRQLHTGEHDQRSVLTVQVSQLPEQVLECSEEARFAPSVAFRKLEPGQIQIWHEAGSYVIAIPAEDGSALHAQALTARVLDGDAAAEIRCIFAALEMADLDVPVHSLTVTVTGEPTEVPWLPSFTENLNCPITLTEEPMPVTPKTATRLVPDAIVQQRTARHQRRMLILGILAFTCVLVAVFGAFAARVWLRQKELVTEQARMDELEPRITAVRDAQMQWETLAESLKPNHYPIENIHQLVELLPPEGIRITRMELRLDGIILNGEASSIVHGQEFRDKLSAAPAFRRWFWDMPNPTTLPDGRATFVATARLAEAVAAEQAANQEGGATE